MAASLRILGCSGGMPANGRWCTSQLLNWENSYFLLDCGEGTQMRLQEYFPKKHKISHIFISHLHGDHIYGLPGLLSSFMLQRRTTDLQIIGPVGLETWLKNTMAFGWEHLTYPLTIQEFDITEKTKICSFYKLEVYAIPLEHRVKCHGYIFGSNPERDRNIRVDQIEKLQLDWKEIKDIKAGNDLVRGKEVISNSELTHPLSHHSYAFCTDTRYFEAMIAMLDGVETLYLECTYESGLQELALKNFHCSTRDVIQVAKEAKIKTTIVGHFSARYGDLSKIAKELNEGSIDFILGEDGLEIQLY